MKLTQTWAWALLLMVGLAACGGEKAPPANTTPTATVNLSGIAYKGILKSAEVSAYEVINGVVSASPLKTVTTDAMGHYSLDLKPTSNPVVLKVKTTSATRMLDESVVYSDGSFQEVAAPVGLEMRSYVTHLQDNAVAMINPITEQALVLAEKTKKADSRSVAGLTPEVLRMAKATVQEAMANQDAFLIKPPSTVSEISASAVHAVVVGLAHQSRTDTTCAMSCQIEKMSGKNKTLLEATLGPNGSLVLTADAVLALQQPIQNAAQTAAGVLAGTHAASAVQIARDAVKAATVSTTSPTLETIEARNSFSSFVSAMRDGFKLTEKSLQTETESLHDRYQNRFITSNANFLNVLNIIDCEYGLKSSCDPSDAIVWTSKQGSLYRRFNGTSKGYTITGEVINQPGDFRLREVLVSSSAGILLSVPNLSIVRNERQNSGNSSTITNTLKGSIEGFEYVAGSRSKMSITYTDVKYSWVSADFCRYTTCKDGSETMSGQVALTLDEGDTFTGRFEMAQDEWLLVTEHPTEWNRFLYAYKSYITKFQLNLSGQANNKSLLSLGINMAGQGRPPLGDQYPVSASNFSSNTANFKLALIEGSEIDMTLQHTVWDQFSAVLNVKAGEHQLSVSTLYKANVVKTNQNHCRLIRSRRFCADTMKLESADKTYTAELHISNGKVAGDVMKGAIKVAEVKDGIVYANGQMISLY